MIARVACVPHARSCVASGVGRLCRSLLSQWKHSSSADNSWIKEKQILDCSDLIAEFKAAEANKRAGGHKGKSTAKKSTSSKKTTHQKKK
jgi:hypothetical protein